jgi:sec-independent protein translocase protein TatB
MEFLGIGPLELLFIILIILLIVGPKDVARVSRTIGHALNRLYRSDNYKLIQKASTELRNLPQELMKEANLEELQKMAEIPELKESFSINPPEKSSTEQPLKAWVEELPPSPPVAEESKNSETKNEAAPATETPPPKDHPSA